MRHRSWFIMLAVLLLNVRAHAANAPAASGLSPYAQLEAAAGRGFLGDKEDGADLGSVRVFLSKPKGWSDTANVSVGEGKFFYFLRYQPQKNDPGTIIFLTGVKVGPADTDVLKYSKELVAGLRKKSPTDRISEPKLIKMKEADAAYFEQASGQNTSCWFRYQFLVAGRVLKLQLTGPQKPSPETRKAFDQLARSIRIETK